MRKHVVTLGRAFISCVLLLTAACNRDKQASSQVEVKTDPVAVKPDITTPLRALWGSSDSDIWAVGSTGSIVHYDGKTWQGVESGTTQNLTGVSGTAKDDVWVIGENGTTLHYDGKAWTAIESKEGRSQLGIWAVGRTDVWIGGFENAVGLLRHYTDAKRPSETKAAQTAKDAKGAPDAKAASAKPAPDAKAAPAAKTAPPDTKPADTQPPPTEAASAQETKGIPHWEQLPIGGSTSLWRTWASGPNDVWLVGSDDHARGFIMRGDGKQFDRVTYDVGTLRGIYGTEPNNVWAAAYDGTLHHWDGMAWSQSLAVPDAHWLGLWGTGANDVWAFGLDGVLYRYDGKAWAKVESGSKEIVWAAWGSGPKSIWFVGNNGTRLHWNGHAFAK